MVNEVSSSDVRTLYALSSVHKRRYANPFTIKRMTVRKPALLLVAEGKGVIHINEAAYALEPLQVCFIPAGATIEAAAHTNQAQFYAAAFEAVHIVKQNGGWRTVQKEEGSSLFPAGPLPVQDAKPLLQRFEELQQSRRAREGAAELDLQLQALVAAIRCDLTARGSGAASESGIDSTIAYMHKHFTEKLSRETLAEIAKLTPNAFCRSFKRTTGLSPTDYLNRVRINHAKGMLGPDSSVKDVAASVGFGSEYYFSRMFKETVGLSPTLFIKRERLRVATASRVGYDDNLADLGMDVVAAVDCYRYPGMDENEYGLKLLSQLEQLKLVKPDLIVGDFVHAPLSESLRKIAPTVLLEHDLNWRATHMRLAELVGREREAERSFGKLQEQTAEARLLLSVSASRETVTVMQMIARGIRIQGAVNHPLNELIYAELGLTPGPAVPRNRMRDEWGYEDAFSVDTDYLFIINSGGTAAGGAPARRLRPGSADGPHQASAARHAYAIPNWLVMSWTPRGRADIVRQLVRTLV